MVTKEQLDKFKAIYRKVYGHDISDAEALGQATQLLNLMAIVYRRRPEDQKEKPPEQT
jgi:hypothetical protein